MKKSAREISREFESRLQTDTNTLEFFGYSVVMSENGETVTETVTVNNVLSYGKWAEIH